MSLQACTRSLTSSSLIRRPYARFLSLTKTLYDDRTGDASTVNVPSKEVVTPFPPLSEPISGPTVTYAEADHPCDGQTSVTELSNGLKVASEKRFGQFCTVGVVIESGPRFEVAYPNGVSHFLEKLAFHSTHNFPDKDYVMKELEKTGGICDCQSSRDTFIYAASADSRGLDSIVRILGDVVLRPQLQLDEIEMARQAIQFELESLNMRPEQEPILMDMIHAAAYRDNTLGFPKLCPEGNIGVIDRSILMSFMKQHYTPKRMVVAGVGVDHDTLVKAVEKYFVNDQPTWETASFQDRRPNQIDTSIAQYTGGAKLEECEIPVYAAVGLPELSHVVIGLEGCSHQDKDFVPACVLNIMMGGGGSFSAGGPGKGMYTRLYTNVLNRFHWMYSATAYNHAYNDSGLFCIHASAPESNVRSMVEVLTREMVNMASEPSAQELKRAKTQLQSMLLMNLESRPVVFEDIGRQVLSTGVRKPPSFFINEIEKVSSADIQRVSRRLLASPPAIAARGQLKQLPDLKDLQAGILNNEGKLPGGGRRLTLFR